ncbi:MAG TPA: beta-galactosidase [Terriglobales bacterium]
MRFSRAIGILPALILAVNLAVAQSPAPARTPEKQKPLIRMATAIGDDYFDGRDTRARVRRHLEIAQELGVEYLRCAFSWNGVEPQQGKFEFAFWDMLVDEAQKAGIEVIPYVAYTPEWAARDGKEFWKQPPKDPRLFVDLMTALATHFRGRIHSWELWNEPDLPEYWQGTPDEFASMIKMGAEAVRTADPSAKIVLGGMSLGPGKFFRELVQKHDIGQYVDVIAMHAYPESWHEARAETVFHEEVQEMEKLIQSGTPRPLWLNEMGYADYRYEPNHASGWGTNVYYDYEHTARYAADFLLKSFLMTAASGDVRLAGWYRIDDFRESDTRMPQDKVHDHLGVERVDGTLKPSFYAFRFFDRLLSKPFRPVDDEVTVTAPNDSQAVVHSFLREDNSVVIAGWLRSSEYDEVPVHTGMVKDRRLEKVTVALPCTASEVTWYDALGQRKKVSRAQVRQLRDVVLTGDRVNVAVVQCSTGDIQ